jgi:hypothetical protein
MKELWKIFLGVLLLDDECFVELRASPDVFRKGFTLLLVIGLIVGLVGGFYSMVVQLINSPAEQIQDAADQMMEVMGQFGAGPEMEMVLENVLQGFQIGARIAEIKSPLPRPVGVFFTYLGAAVSVPFSWIGQLLFYSTLVMLLARLLGGKGSITIQFGLACLATAPYILTAFGFIPCLGGLLGFVAWIWSIVIYVKATAIAQKLTIGKAALAALLPAAISFLLAFLGAGVLAVLIGLASS